VPGIRSRNALRENAFDFLFARDDALALGVLYQSHEGNARDR
jgi:hypothetical protein